MDTTNKNILPSPEIKAEIYYLTEEEGGRKTPVASGYRGQFYYDGNNWDAPQQFLDKQLCNPGEKVKVYIQCLSPEGHIGHLYKGKDFEIREGGKIVGKGTIKELIRQDYQKWEIHEVIKDIEKLMIKPYSNIELDGMIFDIDHFLSQENKFKNIIIEKTDNKECLLKITCRTTMKNGYVANFIHELINIWNDKISFDNEKHKSTIFDSKVEVDFITWHSIYVTGKITVRKD